MDTQMIDSVKKCLLNKNGETFGFSAEDYQSFVTAYSELSYAMAHNDYNLVSLFNLVREQLGKQDFYKLLTTGLRLSASEISDLNRKLAAFQQIPSQIIWNTIGYRGIQKIMSMPSTNRDLLMQDISERGDNLTLKEFYSLYGKYSKNQKAETAWDKDEKWSRSTNRKGSDERISITRSDLERIVRRSVETVMGPSTKGKHGKKNQKNHKFSGSSKLSHFSFQPMMV
jgi:hypothetical protein